MILHSAVRFIRYYVDYMKCILVTCLCVYLSLTAFPHYYTDLDITWGNGRGAPSCALLGGFAIGPLVSLLCGT